MTQQAQMKTGNRWYFWHILTQYLPASASKSNKPNTQKCLSCPTWAYSPLINPFQSLPWAKCSDTCPNLLHPCHPQMKCAARLCSCCNQIPPPCLKISNTFTVTYSPQINMSLIRHLLWKRKSPSYANTRGMGIMLSVMIMIRSACQQVWNA